MFVASGSLSGVVTTLYHWLAIIISLTMICGVTIGHNLAVASSYAYSGFLLMFVNL